MQSVRTTATTTADAPTSVRSADGTLIGWHRSGAGSPAVLLHGTSADAASWALASPHLAPRHTLLAVDRRGRGRSGPGEPYTFQREVEDLVAVVSTCDEPPHVVAHSFGAVVALAAAAGGLQVRSLVLYEPPLTSADHIDVGLVASECERALAVGDREQVLRTFYRAIGEEPAIDMLKAVPPVFARFLAGAHTIAREVRASAQFPALDAATITAPTLLLLGSESPAHFGDSIAVLHRAVPGSEVATLQGQAHLGHSMDPVAFAATVLSFTAGVA